MLGGAARLMTKKEIHLPTHNDDVAETRICHPRELEDLSRRNFIRNGTYLAGFMAASQLFGARGAKAIGAYPPQKRLIWISLNGGWDILEATDPKRRSTAGVDMVYDWGSAHLLRNGDSDERIGRWLPNIANNGADVVALRGLAMGTTSHLAGSVYMDTGVLSNSGTVNAASIPAIVASESGATIPIIQLSGGAEPLTDRGLLNPVSVVRAQNLSLYQSMYPTTDQELDQRLRILDYLKESVGRYENKVGVNDRLSAIRDTEVKIRMQFQDRVGSKLSLNAADTQPFTVNAPSNLNRGQRDAFALALKLIKNNLVTCINMGVGGFDTHGNQDTRLQPILTQFDYLMGVLIDQLRAANALENTLIVVYSDFGRTPKVNRSNGRDHWPVGGALLVGGGIAGGRFVGGTNDDLQAEYVNTASGEAVPAGTSGATQLNPTHLGGSVLELILGTGYMQYRSYLQSIPALTRLKT